MKTNRKRKRKADQSTKDNAAEVDGACALARKALVEGQLEQLIGQQVYGWAQKVNLSGLRYREYQQKLDGYRLFLQKPVRDLLYNSYARDEKMILAFPWRQNSLGIVPRSVSNIIFMAAALTGESDYIRADALMSQPLESDRKGERVTIPEVLAARVNISHDCSCVIRIDWLLNQAKQFLNLPFISLWSQTHLFAVENKMEVKSIHGIHFPEC